MIRAFRSLLSTAKICVSGFTREVPDTDGNLLTTISSSWNFIICFRPDSYFHFNHSISLIKTRFDEGDCRKIQLGSAFQSSLFIRKLFSTTISILLFTKNYSFHQYKPKKLYYKDAYINRFIFYKKNIKFVHICIYKLKLK